MKSDCLRKKLITFFQDSRLYISHVITFQAHNLFQDDSFGLMMTLTIVRIIRLEVESTKVRMYIHYYKTIKLLFIIY